MPAAIVVAVHAIVALTDLLSERSRVLLSTECTVRGVGVVSGEALMRQGETGDAFYIIRRGVVDARARGMVVQTVLPV